MPTLFPEPINWANGPLTSREKALAKSVRASVLQSSGAVDGACVTLAGIVGFVAVCVVVWAIWKKYHAVQSLPPEVLLEEGRLTALELPSLLHSSPRATQHRELHSKSGIDREWALWRRAERQDGQGVGCCQEHQHGGLCEERTAG